MGAPPWGCLCLYEPSPTLIEATQAAHVQSRMWSPSGPHTTLGQDLVFDETIRAAMTGLGWFVAELAPNVTDEALNIVDRIFTICKLLIDRQSAFTLFFRTSVANFLKRRSAKQVLICSAVKRFVLDSGLEVLSNAPWVGPTNEKFAPSVQSWVQAFLDAIAHVPRHSEDSLPRPFLRGPNLSAPRVEKERLDNTFLGGLRNPNHSCAASHGLRALGSKIRATLEDLGRLGPLKDQVLKTVGALGTSSCQGFGPELLLTTRRSIRKSVGLDPSGPTQGFDPELWKALLEAAHDPETEVPKWLQNGCPVGTKASPIHSCGIFPPSNGPSSAILASRAHADLAELHRWRHEAHKNYVSFYAKGGQLAQEEVSRIERKGFIETFDTWDQVTRRWPNALASKVALIVKERDDGTVKVRMVIDLRRSGGNGYIELPERVVLLRLSDLTASITDLM